jgi:hypothetical protein
MLGEALLFATLWMTWRPECTVAWHCFSCALRRFLVCAMYVTFLRRIICFKVVPSSETPAAACQVPNDAQIDEAMLATLGDDNEIHANRRRLLTKAREVAIECRRSSATASFTCK